MFLCVQHSAGVNCLAVLKSSGADGCDYLFTGSRDGTLKRWALMEDASTCSTTFESHVDWVLFFSLHSVALLIFSCIISY
jgi:WD40 repeat protein